MAVAMAPECSIFLSPQLQQIHSEGVVCFQKYPETRSQTRKGVSDDISIPKLAIFW